MAKKLNTVVEPVETTTVIDAPYEQPEGWRWGKLGDFIYIYRGVSYKKTDAHSEKLQNDCLILRGGNIEEGKINTDADNVYVDKSLVSENQFIKKNDVIIVTSTGSTKVIGRAGISDYDYSGVAFGAFLTLARPNGKSDKLFVNQYFQSPLYRERIRQLASGVNINNIRTDYITESPFPLPPTLAEQQRIVNRIESMFTKLDEAKEKAQNVVESFETRKAAILHQAFTGNLTAKWRKENGIKSSEIDVILNKLFLIREKMIKNKEIQKPKIKENFDTNFVRALFPEWKVVKLGSIAFVTKLAGFEYTKYINLEETGDIPAIRAQNVRKGYLDESNLLYISKETSEFLQRSALTKKSVLVTFIGAGIGDVCVFDKETRYHLAPNVAKVEPFNSDKNEYIDVKYILYYLLSHFGQHEIFKDMKATAQPSLSMETIRDITIPIPTIGEQKEIVRILDTVLEKERTAKSAAEQILEQIDLLKKSILARAFRGEL